MYTGRKIYTSKSIALAKSCKEIYVSNLQKVSIEPRLEEVHLTQPQPCKYDVRVNYANSNILWHFNLSFWLQSFGTRNSSLVNAKMYLLLYSFCFVLFWIRGQFSSISPWGLIFGGAYRYTWRGLFSEFYGMCLQVNTKFKIQIFGHQYTVFLHYLFSAQNMVKFIEGKVIIIGISS